MSSTSRELSLGNGRKLQLLFKCNLDILKSAVMDLSPWRQIFYPSFLHQKSALHSQIWSSLHGLSYGGYMLIKLCPNEQQKLTECFCSPPFQLILTVILFFFFKPQVFQDKNLFLCSKMDDSVRRKSLWELQATTIPGIEN